MKVKELVSNRIWTINNVLPEELMSQITEEIKLAASFGKVVTSENTVPKYCYSGFHYLHFHLNDRLREKAFQAILQAIQQVWPQYLRQNQSLKTSSIFLKGFETNSYYHLHAEDRSVFGDFAYNLYLTNESSGPIIFPAFDELQEAASDIELTNWKIMENFLEQRGSKPQYLNKTATVYPTKNTCLLFKTGVPHKVEAYQGPAVGRFCITGFPGAVIP